MISGATVSDPGVFSSFSLVDDHTTGNTEVSTSFRSALQNWFKGSAMPSLLARRLVTNTSESLEAEDLLALPLDMTRTDSAWHGYVMRRLKDLREGRGDFTGLERPTALVVGRAGDVASALFPSDTPAPSVVPSEDGEVEFYWHRAGWELEIDVGLEGVWVWARHRASGIVLSDTLDESWPWVARLLQLLARH